MPSSNLPVLGAALTVEMIERHRDWLFDADRDVEVQSFFDGSVLDGDWGPLAARGAKALAGHRGRIGLHGPFVGFRIDPADRAIREVVTRRLLQGLEVCAALGASQMVIHSPISTWDHNNQLAIPQQAIDQTARVHETLRPVVARALDIGVTLVIENIEDRDPAARVALARSFASPAVRVSIDTGHAHYACVSTGAPPVDVYVTAAGDMLDHVHLQDADGFADRHWHPGEGTIGWPAVFKALGLLPCAPRLMLEVKDQDDVAAGARHLAELGLAV